MSAMDVDAGVEEKKGGEVVGPATAAVSTERTQKGKGEGDRNIMLHPLTVITISDHHTRVSTGGGAQEAGGRVIGLLFGSQNGLDVSIYDAMEVACTAVGADGLELNETLVEQQKEIYTAVYPMYEILGWYTVGTAVTELDLGIQRQMTKFNSAPLFLLMNPSPAQGSKELPVLIHESESHMLDGRSKSIFVQLAFQLETTQAEQISVEHVAKATPTEGMSSIDLHAGAVSTSLRTLLARIEILRRFLEETKNGSVKVDYPLLRQISSICNQLPTMDGAQFSEEFMREFNDSLSVAYLASVQKSAGSVNDLADKFMMAFGHRRTL